tara:strand:+ start:466 stop:600 length:135 start_codon:yes stop_codon:yes gene_type:complete
VETERFGLPLGKPVLSVNLLKKKPMRLGERVHFGITNKQEEKWN